MKEVGEGGSEYFSCPPLSTIFNGIALTMHTTKRCTLDFMFAFQNENPPSICLSSKNQLMRMPEYGLPEVEVMN